jgi:hypothetical protein
MRKMEKLQKELHRNIANAGFVTLQTDMDRSSSYRGKGLYTLKYTSNISRIFSRISMQCKSDHHKIKNQQMKL